MLPSNYWNCWTDGTLGLMIGMKYSKCNFVILSDLLTHGFGKCRGTTRLGLDSPDSLKSAFPCPNRAAISTRGLRCATKHRLNISE